VEELRRPERLNRLYKGMMYGKEAISTNEQ
jgi:hypothetical protein